MSTCPGHRLEDFLLWDYNLVLVDGEGVTDVNPSLMLAEALGTATRYRQRVNRAQLAVLVAIFEPNRESVENALDGFDADEMSWRSYASSAFSFLTRELYDAGAAFLARRTIPKSKRHRCASRLGCRSGFWNDSNPPRPFTNVMKGE